MQEKQDTTLDLSKIRMKEEKNMNQLFQINLITPEKQS